MTAKEVLAELVGAGAQTWVEDGQLCLRAPAGGLTPELRARVIERKPQIVALLGQHVRYALPSFAQQRLWLIDQLEAGRSAYNVLAAMRLRGALDALALEQSLREVARRHDVLRTHFMTFDAQPLQVIDRADNLLMRRVELSALECGEQDAALERLISAEARRAFDLSVGPLVRFVLVRLAPNDHVVVMAAHHSVCDGWSMGVLTQELAALYPALSSGKPSLLPALTLQYADYAAWQRQWLAGPELDRQLAYWRQQLGGELPVLELPTDKPRPPVQSYRGATESLMLDGSVIASLEDLCQREGVTLFMSLLAAFQTLLNRYSGQDEIVVGTPIANRGRQDFEYLIGLFVNTLVLRTNLSGDPTFRDVLARVREVALGAYAHQDLPFERLVEELRPARDLSRPPLFQVLFVMQNTPPATLELAGLDLEPLAIDTGTAKFDLSLSIEARGTGTVATLEYSTDLFEAATARRILGHFQVLLAGIAANPAQAISALPVLTTAERQQVVHEWNATGVDYGGDMCLHEHIEAQAERTPDAVAVVFEDQTLTFSELDQRANQLAHHLQHLGVRPEGLVGVCMERSLDLVVALLGILKAGGAYVPLDPSYPTERLAFMVEDAQAPVLLSQSHLANRLPAHNAQLVCMDTDWPSIARQPGTPAARLARAENLAYVIFTSGSTGRPKGGMNAHRGIVNRLLWMQDAYQLKPDDRVLQKTPFSFDVSVWEFFWPLITGARLILARPEGHKDPAYLAELIRSEAITTLHFVPSMLQVFLDVADLRACTSLRRVICSGEALSVELHNRCLARLPWAQLHNLYGPTEAAVDVTAWACRAGDAVRSVPIGRPIANTQIYLLDRTGQPVPIGVPGELHIGGVQVGRGYWRREELTAEKFVANPFGEGRLYRTGDLARWRPDGAIEYLGRLDHQIKLRGFRIELGEIETALAEHPEVNETVVVVQPDPASSERRLVAYIVPRSGATLTTDALRAHLRQRLPEYMLPATCVVLDALPLSPNGKVDRKMLPAPDHAPAAPRSLVAPRDALESALAEIWAETFKVLAVSITDDFFELGGHSLLAVRLMALIEERFGQRLPLSSLFQGPTIEHLAQVIRDRPSAVLWSPLVPIQPEGAKPPFFCVHPTGGDVLCYQHLARLLGPDQPFYGLQAVGLDGHEKPLTRIADMAARYLVEVQQAQPHGPYYLGGWSFGGLVAFEMAQQLRQRGEDVALLAIIDCPAPVRADGAQDKQNFDRAEWARWFVMIAAEFEDVFRENLSLTFDDLRQFSPEEQLERFLARLDAANFLPQGAGRSIARGFWRLHEANIRAMWNYAAEAQTYTGPVTVFRSTEPLAAAEGETWQREVQASPTLGWNLLATGALRVHAAPGNHNTLLSPPHVDVLAAALRADLDEAFANAASPAGKAPGTLNIYQSRTTVRNESLAGDVRLEGLTRTYETAQRTGLFKSERRVVEALKGLHLHIKPGEIFGLLGPNGAGKTTLIKCLSTLLSPTRGEALINGFRLGREDNQIRSSIGCMLMGERGLYWKLTGRENLEFFGALYHLSERERRARAAEIIERLGMEEIADRAVETYSSGQKMRLAFGKALVNDAPLLILDEPTNTLDLPSATDLRAVVRDLNCAGKTVIYTTHIMSEAELMCDRVAIIDRGEILALGTVAELKGSLTRAEVIRVEGVIPAQARAAVAALPGVARVAMAAVNGHTELKVVGSDQHVLLPQVIQTLVSHNSLMRKIVPEEPTLEDVFVAHTGRVLAETPGVN